MASIQRIERNKGTTYKIIVFIGVDSTGKQIRKTTTFIPKTATFAKQEKEAKKFAMEFEEKVLNGRILSGERMSLEEYCNMYLEEAKRNLVISTYEYYCRFIETKLIPELGCYKMSDIKPKHIRDFLAHLTREDGQELKPSSIKKNLAVVKSIFKTAWFDEIISSNPAERVRLPRRAESIHNIQCFNQEQAEIFLKLLDCGLEYEYAEHTRTNRNGTKYVVSTYTQKHDIPKQFKVFFSIALFGGLRKGEILALTWKDIDFNSNVISITKSVCYSNKEIIVKAPKTRTSVRKVKLPVSVMQLIKEYEKEWLEYKQKLGHAWKGTQDFLFIQSTGELMHPSTPYHTFKKIVSYYNSTVEESKKLPSIPLHGLRHTSATLLIASQIDIPTVARRLGHAQKSTTMNLYVHALEELDEVASSKMEQLFFRKENE